MTDLMDTALNWQPGIRIAPDAKQWWATNGIAPPIPLCETCRQFVYEGHVDCTCDKNHPENCDRPTYDELLRVGQHDDFDPFTPAERFEHQRKVAGDNMDFAMRYRKVLQALLDRHNADGDSLAPTVLSPTDVAEIKAALDWRVY